MRWLTFVVVLLLVGAGGAGTAGAADLDHDLAIVLAAAPTFDCHGDVVPAIGRLVADPAIDKRSDFDQLQIWGLATICASDAHQYDLALGYSRHATAFPLANDYLWLVRIRSAAMLDRSDEMVEAVESLVTARPKTLNIVPPSQVSQFLRKRIAEGRTDLVWRFLSDLEKADYAPDWPSQSADELWLMGARLAADGGDQALAGRFVARLSNVRYLIAAKLDARFAQHVAAAPAQFDLKAAAERQLARDRSWMLGHPDRLDGVLAVVTDLRGLERFDEAGVLIQAARARAALSTPGAPAFKDGDQQMRWLLEMQAMVTAETGGAPDVVNSQLAAIALAPDGKPRATGQGLDYAIYLVDAGRPADAIRLLEGFDNAPGLNDKGRSVMHMARACADARLDRDDDLKAELGYLSQHDTDDPDALTHALLCANDLNAVAIRLIRALKDSGARESVLVSLCQFDVPAPPQAWSATLAGRVATVIARQEVSDAIAAAGHRERIPLNGGVYGMSSRRATWSCAAYLGAVNAIGAAIRLPVTGLPSHRAGSTV